MLRFRDTTNISQLKCELANGIHLSWGYTDADFFIIFVNKNVDADDTDFLTTNLENHESSLSKQTGVENDRYSLFCVNVEQFIKNRYTFTFEYRQNIPLEITVLACKKLNDNDIEVAMPSDSTSSKIKIKSTIRYKSSPRLIDRVLFRSIRRHELFINYTPSVDGVLFYSIKTPGLDDVKYPVTNSMFKESIIIACPKHAKMRLGINDKFKDFYTLKVSN